MVHYFDTFFVYDILFIKTSDLEKTIFLWNTIFGMPLNVTLGSVVWARATEENKGLVP